LIYTKFHKNAGILGKNDRISGYLQHELESFMMDREEIQKRIDAKYRAMDQNPDVHLEGLSWSNPITYWDYILPDALLGLQVQRTDQPDEMVFIMYHQINELLF